MMVNFARTATVSIGPDGGEGVLIRDNRIAFQIVKTDDPAANTLELQLYNLSPQTRALAEDRNNIVILTCGYALGEKETAIANIARTVTEYSPPDQVTSVQCAEGLRSLADSRVSLSYSGAISAKAVIDDISSRMGLELRETEADLSGTFRQGWAFTGPARDALQSVTRRFGLSWSVQGDEIQIVQRRGVNTLEAVLISPQTGLIGSPLPLDDVGTDLENDAEEPGLRITTLLNPLIEPAGVIVLQSREYDAQYRVRRVEHRGDTRGAVWESVIEAVEI